MTEVQNNQQQNQEDLQKAIKHVQEELQKNQLSAELITALQTCEAILKEKATIAKFDDIAAFLAAEELALPADFEDKKEVHVQEENTLQSSLPSLLDAAFENVTHRNLLKFVGHYRDRKSGPQFAYFVKNLSEENKTKFYHVIRSEKITDVAESQMIFEFEQVIGYSFEFAKKNILTSEDTDEDTREVLEFVQKYTGGYTAAVKDTLKWMKMVRNAQLDDARITNYTETALRRFEISKDREPEEIKAIGLELLEIFKRFFPNYQGEATASQS